MSQPTSAQSRIGTARPPQRRAVTIVAATVMAMCVGVLQAPAVSSATIGTGKPCARAGQTATVKGTLYQCETWGTLRWVVRQTSKIPKYEIDYLRNVTNRVIEDVATADCRAQDGIGVASTLRFLADDFEILADDAVLPPGVRAASYVSRARTLAKFAEQAADEIDDGFETQGYARYAVVKEEALPLLAMINKGLGTNFTYTTRTAC